MGGGGSDTKNAALAIARGLLDRGWKPVPVVVGKAPKLKNWQKIKITCDNARQYFNGAKLNVGAQMGPVSKGLTDADLDCAEAIALAPYFLPGTSAIYGRPSKPRSHYLYYGSDPEPKASIKWNDENNTVIVELRMGGGGKGAQSVMPGSVHPSGEVYAWDVEGEPAKATCADLKATLTQIAVGVLLMRHWPGKGGRHDGALGIGGFLARAGWEPDEIAYFIEAVCREVGDDEVDDRTRAARDSAENYAKGEHVYGFLWLCEFIGEGVAKRIAKFVGFAEQTVKNKEKRTGLIDELNNKYCVVLEGSKVRVLTFSQQHGREMVNYLTFSDFRNLYMNRPINVGEEKTVPLGGYWLKHPKRRQYDGVVFEPCKPQVVDGNLNLWRGWGIEPKAGDWSLMLRHIRVVLAAGEPASNEYILNYAAWCVQNPGVPAEVALVFKGPEGTGRGIFGRAMCRIFGQHAHQISSIKHLTGEFNKHLRDCCLLFADEAFWPGYRNQEGTLKRLITEPTLFIEPKGIDPFEVKNMLHVIMVSNNKWVIPASIDARRFVMLIVAEHKKQDPTWFSPLYVQMEGGGYAAMLHDLLARDLDDWHPRQIIKTEALYEQQMLSLDSIDPLDAWWFTLLRDGVLPGYQGWVERELDDGREMKTAGDPNPRRAYSNHLYDHARKCVPRLKFESDNNLGHALRDRGCVPFHDDKRGWEFPPLQEARGGWQKRMPLQVWDDEFEDWQERRESEPDRY